MKSIRWLAPLLVASAVLESAALADTLPVLNLPTLAATPSMNGAVDATWSSAAKFSLDYDFTYKRAAKEPTVVYVGQDSGGIDVAFVVTQHESLEASQTSNGDAVTGDDNVVVMFDPQGNAGFQYQFVANPHGARFQKSSENLDYAPEWIAVGTTSKDGYVVTMRIPFNVIRNGGSTSWRVQFERETLATGGLAVWGHDPDMLDDKDPTYAGTITGVGVGSAASANQPAASTRPQARLQLYGLGEVTTTAFGGNTSRVGADLSVPITPTASFVTTFHPDYSNVEVDQQTIAPNPFQRSFAEVRPFFAQAGQFFNQGTLCLKCPMTLYTPSIPTFSSGYAVEGTQGRLTFAGFDALGNDRADSGQTLNYRYEDTKVQYGVNGQRVSVATPFGVDDTTTIDTGFGNQHTHFLAYANLGQDRGTFVASPSLGNYLEAGVGYDDSTTQITVSRQIVGEQFAPLDGFVSQNDIQGFEAVGSKTINFSPTAAIHDFSFTSQYGRFGNHLGRLAQTDGFAQASVDFHDLLSVSAYTSTQGILTQNGEFLPFDSNGFSLGYGTNTTSPTSVTYNGGRYFHGDLDSWSYLATLPVAQRLHLSLEADENQYLSSYPGEYTFRDWLDRASLDWQFNPNASFDVGARRVIGPILPNAFQPAAFGNPAQCLQNPTLPACDVLASNVSLAFHFLKASNEFYIVYGDPNSQSTTPALFLKWIRYIGAQKGT